MAKNKLNYIEADESSVVLGSGQLYAMVHTSAIDYKTITEEDMTDLGYIQANAALTATSESSDLTAANGGVIGTFKGNKDVQFSTGIISWNLENVSNFLTGSTYEVDELTGKKTFYYGDADKSPNVFLRFVSEDDAANKRITIDMFKANFMGELAIDFNAEDPVTFDYSFKLLSTTMPNGKKGYFLVGEEDIDPEVDPEV